MARRPVTRDAALTDERRGSLCRRANFRTDLPQPLAPRQGQGRPGRAGPGGGRRARLWPQVLGDELGEGTGAAHGPVASWGHRRCGGSGPGNGARPSVGVRTSPPSPSGSLTSRLVRLPVGRRALSLSLITRRRPSGLRRAYPSSLSCWQSAERQTRSPSKKVFKASGLLVRNLEELSGLRSKTGATIGGWAEKTVLSS